MNQNANTGELRVKLSAEIAHFCHAYKLHDPSDSAVRCHYECLRWSAERGHTPQDIDLFDILCNHHDPLSIAEQVDYLWLILKVMGERTSEIHDMARSFAIRAASANFQWSEYTDPDRLSTEEYAKALGYQQEMYFFADHSAIVLPGIMDGSRLPIVFDGTQLAPQEQAA